MQVGFPLILAVIGYTLPLMFALCVSLGVVFIPLMPLTFDYATDILFPAGEAQITGCLMATGNLIGAILVKMLLFR